MFFDLALAHLRRAADLLAPVHARTDGVDGWVSLEVSPLLAHDTPRTVDQAESLHREAALSNLFIKIPGTAEGLPAIEECIYAGVPVNVTLLFSAEQYRAAAEAYQFLPADGGDADQVIAAFAQAGIDTAILAAELQRQGAEAFAASWQDLLARIGACSAPSWSTLARPGCCARAGSRSRSRSATTWPRPAS